MSPDCSQQGLQVRGNRPFVILEDLSKFPRRCPVVKRRESRATIFGQIDYYIGLGESGPEITRSAMIRADYR